MVDDKGSQYTVAVVRVVGVCLRTCDASACLHPDIIAYADQMKSGPCDAQMEMDMGNKYAREY